MKPINRSKLKIYYLIKSKDWKELTIKRDLYKIANYILQKFNIKMLAPNIELSILLTDESGIKEINKEYRNINKPTNVIALAINNLVDDTQRSIYGDTLALGDIIMSFENIFREAQEQSKSFSNHFKHLFVHGLLHLIGYDHQNDDAAEIMEKLEIDILKKFDISSPYATS